MQRKPPLGEMSETEVCKALGGCKPAPPRPAPRPTVAPAKPHCAALAKYACTGKCSWTKGYTVAGKHVRGRCVAR